MRFASVTHEGRPGVAAGTADQWCMMFDGDEGYPGNLTDAVRAGPNAVAELARVLQRDGAVMPIASVVLRPPIEPQRIFCVGLNYADHAAEANMKVPEHPTLFSRFASSVVAPGAPIRLPRASSQLDFEGELAVIVGKEGRSLAPADALDYVAGYACFNDASVRDFQLRTTQWMLGKNFDGTGPFGPFLVTPEELPPGASGLKIQTRLNGDVVQSSSTDQLIFDVATLIADISVAVALLPGDVIVTGTPAGVGNARTPKLFMKDGDLCEVEIDRLGVLANRVAADA